MELTFRWGISLINGWILVCCVSQIPHTYGTFNITEEGKQWELQLMDQMHVTVFSLRRSDELLKVKI